MIMLPKFTVLQASAGTASSTVVSYSQAKQRKADDLAQISSHRKNDDGSIALVWPRKRSEMASPESAAILCFAIAVVAVIMVSVTEAAVPQWCVADPQAPNDMLQGALDWTCGSSGGADCSSIQANEPCFADNLVAHASVAFNSYWQKFKNQGASCYFDAVALITEDDPSHGSCVFPMVAGSGISNGTSDGGPIFGYPLTNKGPQLTVFQIRGLFIHLFLLKTAFWIL